MDLGPKPTTFSTATQIRDYFKRGTGGSNAHTSRGSGNYAFATAHGGAGGSVGDINIDTGRGMEAFMSAFFGKGQGLDKILETIGKIGGGTQDVNALIEALRTFGMTAGERAAQFLNQAYPGTSPWDQLGTAAQGNAQGSAQAQRAHEDRINRGGWINATRNAAISAIDHIGTEMMKDLPAAQKQQLWNQLKDTLQGLAGERAEGPLKLGKDLDLENPTTLTEAQLGINQRQQAAQARRWLNQTKIEQKRADIEWVRAQNDTARLIIESGQLDVALAEIPIKRQQADAAIQQAEAALKQADTAEQRAEIERQRIAIDKELREATIEIQGRQVRVSAGTLRVAKLRQALDEKKAYGLDLYLEQLERATAEGGSLERISEAVTSNDEFWKLMTLMIGFRTVEAAGKSVGNIAGSATKGPAGAASKIPNVKPVEVFQHVPKNVRTP